MTDGQPITGTLLMQMPDGSFRRYNPVTNLWEPVTLPLGVIASPTPAAAPAVQPPAVCPTAVPQICPAPQGPMPSPTLVPYQVRGAPICEEPCMDPERLKLYNINIWPCEPRVFIACDRDLVFRDPKGSWMEYNPKTCQWERLELEVCLPTLYQLYWDVDNSQFFYKDGGGGYWVFDPTHPVGSQWVKSRRFHCYDFAEVFIFRDTWELFYENIWAMWQDLIRETDRLLLPEVLSETTRRVGLSLLFSFFSFLISMIPDEEGKLCGGRCK